MPEDKVDLRRRQSFSHLLGTLLVSAEEVQGHRHCALSDLESLEREKFAKLIPGMGAEFDLFISKGSLMARNRNTKEKIQLFQIDSELTTAFNLINKRNNIDEIIKIFSEEMNWKDEEAYPFVKKLIVDLVRLQVCRFSNPSED
jgi:hypothetical protein